MHRTYSMRQTRAPTASQLQVRAIEAYSATTQCDSKTDFEQNPPPPPSSTKSGRLFKSSFGKLASRHFDGQFQQN
jgi:hypothetical protein